MEDHIKDIASLIKEEVSEALCYRFLATPKGPLPKVRITPEKPRMRLSRILEPEGWVILFLTVAPLAAGGFWLIRQIKWF
jgi:hypothetical protein